MDRELKMHQKARLSELQPGTWPLSRQDAYVQKNGGDIGENGTTQSLETLLQLMDAHRDNHAQEYGAEQLALYRQLRDSLYQAPRASIQEKFALLFPFPGKGLARASGPALHDHHDEATAELAAGFDACMAQAQQEWAALDHTQQKQQQPDLMAVLGDKMADWCASYTPSCGVDRRWAVYGAMNDKELTKALASLPLRRPCHMKDALCVGLSGHQVVETILFPLAAMFADAPFDATYTGSSVWPLAVLSTLTLWADYAGAEDAKSSAGVGAFDTTAAAALALASLEGSAADELKACIVTLYGAKLGVFRGDPRSSATSMWRSRGYDGAIEATAGCHALARGVPLPEDPRVLDLAAVCMATHDAIDLEADVAHRTEVNLILVSVFRGIPVQTIVNTVYATYALNWTATDLFGQLVLSIIQEQASSSRWGGPVYASESRLVTDQGNLWTDVLSDDEQIASVIEANILPTTTDALSAILPKQNVVSWHGLVLAASAQEILAKSFAAASVDHGQPIGMAEITQLSKGTLTLLACTSCSLCGANTKLGLDDWLVSDADGARVILAVDRIREVIDAPLQRLREWIASDHRPDAIYRITAEAFMAGTLDSRYTVALLEALIIEDALYHGQDLIGYCVGWLPEKHLWGCEKKMGCILL